MRKHYERILHDSESRVQRYLDIQILDENSPFCGGFPKADSLAEPKTAIYRATTMTACYLNPESRYYLDAELGRRLALALAFVRRSQRPGGYFDLINCNFFSGPDTAFCTKRLLPAYVYLCKVVDGALPAAPEAKAAAAELKPKYEAIIRDAADALCHCGFHTPNHRWAIASVLMLCAKLFDKPECRTAAEAILNEGNDWDAGDHFLQLSNREEELIDLVTSNFDNVIVVYNGANAFEMGWVKDYPQIKGVLLCPGTGQSGFEGFGRVVAGEVNPSGRTADTYVTDLTASPWWNNFGDFKYTNASEFNSNASMFDPEGTTPSFVNYVEGIYVGYKFYETAADEGLIDYDKEVVYPFGYGLSYTTFTQKMSDITNDGADLKFSVTVTNTGSVAGKDVVEIYSDPPYTNGGIEKASANLLDFAKTDELAPGESETIDFTIPVEELASYDYQNNGCYVLEAGDYVISTNADSHTSLDSKTCTFASDIVYNLSLIHI